MKKITIVTPCYNEEANVAELYRQVKAVFADLPDYDFEHVFTDNASKDHTLQLLRTMAGEDPRVKVIVNARNFGAVRSQFYSLLQAQGDAAILMAADLQDPPALIADFLAHWQKGYKIVLGVKASSEESAVMFHIRQLFYHLLGWLSDAEVDLVKNFTGFGLYDQSILQLLRQIDDPYPYLRGLVAEIGFGIARIPYQQPARRRGRSSQNLYTNYDLAMVGITQYSKLPLRLATLGGFILAVFCLGLALFYLIVKLFLWPHLELGMVLLTLALFLLAAVQLFFIGILGEYIYSIHTQVRKRPLVIERERINFDA